MQADHNGTSKLTRKQLALVHMAKKELCLDDGDYRDLLVRVCGKRSAKYLLPEDLPALQREFRRLGWRGYLLSRREFGEVKLKYTDMDNRPGRPNGRQLRMLEAMFVDIPGYATINPTAAFRAFLTKRFRISDPRLLDLESYEKALAAVRAMQARCGVE